jgi:hypothetical protein
LPAPSSELIPQGLPSMKYCRLPQAELQLTWPDTVKDWPKVIGFGAMTPVMLVADLFTM